MRHSLIKSIFPIFILKNDIQEKETINIVTSTDGHIRLSGDRKIPSVPNTNGRLLYYTEKS